MEHADHLKTQIARYQHLLENVSLDAVAVTRVRAALSELEEELRLEGAPWRSGVLQTG